MNVAVGSEKNHTGQEEEHSTEQTNYVPGPDARYYKEQCGDDEQDPPPKLVPLIFPWAVPGHINLFRIRTVAVHPNIDPLCFSERLPKYNQDFEVLQKLEESNLDFSVVEINELRALLGLYGGETEKRLPPGYESRVRRPTATLLGAQGRADSIRDYRVRRGRASVHPLRPDTRAILIMVAPWTPHSHSERRSRVRPPRSPR